MNKNTKFYISLVIFYLCLFFAFNNISLFISFFIFACLLFFWGKIEIINIFWYLLLISLPFDLGKGFPVSSVIAQSGGYRVWVTLYPNLLFVFWLLILKKLRTKKSFLKKTDIFWLLILLFSSFSVFEADIKSIAVYGWVELFKGIVIFFLARNFLKVEKISKRSFLIIVSWLFFEGIISLGQFFLKSPIGLYIEEGKINISHGTVAMDSYFLFRSFGTFVAPNRLGAFSVLSLLITASSFMKPSFWENNIFVFLSFILGSWGLILSLSRTSWFAFILFSTISFIHLIRKKYHIDERIKKTALFVLICLFVFAPFLVVRIKSLINAFSYYGTGSVRLKLIKEALHLIYIRPFTGVGFNHFTKALVEWPATDVKSFFLQPVHNIYLLLAAEAGLPVLIFFLLAVIYVLRQNNKSSRKLTGRRYTGYIFLKNAVFAYLFIGFFEPFFLQPVFDLFLLILGMMEVISESKQ